MYQENESEESEGGGGYKADPAQLQITRRDLGRRDDAILLCCITNNYFFSIQVGLDIFVRLNQDVEPMWACNLHEYYRPTDFRTRVQNVFRKYKERAKILPE